MVRDPQSGKYRRTRLFVLTLGYSRKSVRLLLFRSSSRIWAELHEKAFRRLGWVSARGGSRQFARRCASFRTSTIPLSIHCFEMCSHTTVWWLCLAGLKIPIAKEKWNRVSATRRKLRSKGSASRVWKKRRRIWIAGKNAGPIRAFMARRNGKWRPCSPRKNHPCSLYLSNPSATTSTENASFIWTVVWRSKLLITDLPPGWIGRSVKVQWDALHVRILHPGTNQLLREHLRQKRGWYRIQERRPPKENAVEHRAAVAARRTRRNADRQALPVAIYQQQGRDAAFAASWECLSLIKKYGTAAVEDACAAALDIGVPEYRFVRRYLERRPPANVFPPDRSPDP